MRIEDLKRWQWAVAGILLGLLVSYWRGSEGMEDVLAGRSTIEIAEFQKLLTVRTRAGKPAIKDIRIYPAEDGVYWVLAEQVNRFGRHDGRHGGNDDYLPVKVRTATPFVSR